MQRIATVLIYLSVGEPTRSPLACPTTPPAHTPLAACTCDPIRESDCCAALPPPLSPLPSLPPLSPQDVEEGGETNFPDGTPTRNFKARHASQSLSPCGAQGERAAVVPKKGSALVFW